MLNPEILNSGSKSKWLTPKAKKKVVCVQKAGTQVLKTYEEYKKKWKQSQYISA